MWFWVAIVSVAANILLLLYTRWLLNFIETTNENLQSIYYMISDFAEQTGSVYELEMFYGEPVLTDLIDHSKKIVQDIEDYKELYLYDEDADIDEIPEEQADAP